MKKLTLIVLETFQNTGTCSTSQNATFLAQRLRTLKTAWKAALDPCNNYGLSKREISRRGKHVHKQQKKEMGSTLLTDGWGFISLSEKL